LPNCFHCRMSRLSWSDISVKYWWCQCSAIRLWHRYHQIWAPWWIMSLNSWAKQQQHRDASVEDVSKPSDVENISAEHNYVADASNTDKHLKDHTYMTPSSDGKDRIHQQDTTWYLATLKCIKSQCLLSSATTAHNGDMTQHFLDGVFWSISIHRLSTGHYWKLAALLCHLNVYSRSIVPHMEFSQDWMRPDSNT